MISALNPLVWPALVKVLAIFCAVLLAGRLGLNLGLALICAGPLLGLWVGMAPAEVPALLGRALSGGLTARLGLMVLLIMVLSRLMQQSGRLQGIVDSFGRLVHSPRIVAAVMPSLIGLLPMPGGALFSAPMVEAARPDWRDTTDQGRLLACINYWFRHHGEYWWPLYPGVILAIVLLDVPTGVFIAAMAPLALVHFAAGWYFLLRRARFGNAHGPDQGKGSLGEFLAQTGPIITVIAALPVYHLLEWIAGRWGLALPGADGAALLVGLAAAVAHTALADHLGIKSFRQALWQRQTAEMMVLVLGVITFQAFLAGSGAVALVQLELGRYGIPALVMIGLLPFISGLMSGIAFAMVAASFPLVVPLLAGMHGAQFMAYAGLAFVCGYFGILLSPVHVCLLMCRDYFDSPMGGIYRLMAPALAASAVALAVWFGVMEALATVW